MREYLRRYEEAGVDQVIFVMQAGRNRHEHIMESIEIFGREVLPEFIERDEAQVKAKQRALGPGDRGGDAARRAEDYQPADVGRLLVSCACRCNGPRRPDRQELEATLQQWADDRRRWQDAISAPGSPADR